MSEQQSTTEAAQANAAEDDSVYAFVEVFGHRRHCGRIIEVESFGTKMLRIDEPKEGSFSKGYNTVLYGGGSIFSISYTDLASVERHHRPYQARALPAAITRTEIEDDDDDHHDGDHF